MMIMAYVNKIPNHALLKYVQNFVDNSNGVHELTRVTVGDVMTKEQFDQAFPDHVNKTIIVADSTVYTTISSFLKSF